MSRGSAVLGAVLVVALAAADRVPDGYAVFAVIVAALIVARHRPNIGRLLAGTEPKMGQGGDRRLPPVTTGGSRR